MTEAIKLLLIYHFKTFKVKVNFINNTPNLSIKMKNQLTFDEFNKSNNNLTISILLCYIPLNFYFKKIKNNKYSYIYEE